MRRIVVAFFVCVVVATANFSEDDDRTAEKLMNNIEIFVPKYDYPDMEPLTIEDVNEYLKYAKPVLVVTPSPGEKNASFITFYLHNGLRTIHQYQSFHWLEELFNLPGLKALIFNPHLTHYERFLGTPLRSITIQDDMKISDLLSEENYFSQALYVYVAPAELFDQEGFKNIVKVGNSGKVHNSEFEPTPPVNGTILKSVQTSGEIQKKIEESSTKTGVELVKFPRDKIGYAEDKTLNATTGKEFIRVESSEVGSQALEGSALTKESDFPDAEAAESERLLKTNVQEGVGAKVAHISVQTGLGRSGNFDTIRAESDQGKTEIDSNRRSQSVTQSENTKPKIKTDELQSEISVHHQITGAMGHGIDLEADSHDAPPLDKHFTRSDTDKLGIRDGAEVEISSVVHHGNPLPVQSTVSPPQNVKIVRPESDRVGSDSGVQYMKGVNVGFDGHYDRLPVKISSISDNLRLPERLEHTLLNHSEVQSSEAYPQGGSNVRIKSNEHNPQFTIAANNSSDSQVSSNETSKEGIFVRENPPKHDYIDGNLDHDSIFKGHADGLFRQYGSNVSTESDEYKNNSGLPGGNIRLDSHLEVNSSKAPFQYVQPLPDKLKVNSTFQRTNIDQGGNSFNTSYVYPSAAVHLNNTHVSNKLYNYVNSSKLDVVIHGNIGHSDNFTNKHIQTESVLDTSGNLEHNIHSNGPNRGLSSLDGSFVQTKPDEFKNPFVPPNENIDLPIQSEVHQSGSLHQVSYVETQPDEFHNYSEFQNEKMNKSRNSEIYEKGAFLLDKGRPFLELESKVSEKHTTQNGTLHYVPVSNTSSEVHPNKILTHVGSYVTNFPNHVNHSDLQLEVGIHGSNSQDDTFKSKPDHGATLLDALYEKHESDDLQDWAVLQKGYEDSHPEIYLGSGAPHQHEETNFNKHDGLKANISVGSNRQTDSRYNVDSNGASLHGKINVKPKLDNLKDLDMLQSHDKSHPEIHHNGAPRQMEDKMDLPSPSSSGIKLNIGSNERGKEYFIDHFGSGASLPDRAFQKSADDIKNYSASDSGKVYSHSKANYSGVPHQGEVNELKEYGNSGPKVNISNGINRLPSDRHIGGASQHVEINEKPEPQGKRVNIQAVLQSYDDSHPDDHSIDKFSNSASLLDAAYLKPKPYDITNHTGLQSVNVNSHSKVNYSGVPHQGEVNKFNEYGNSGPKVNISSGINRLPSDSHIGHHTSGASLLGEINQKPKPQGKRVKDQAVLQSYDDSHPGDHYIDNFSSSASLLDAAYLKLRNNNITNNTAPPNGNVDSHLKVNHSGVTHQDEINNFNKYGNSGLEVNITGVSIGHPGDYYSTAHIEGSIKTQSDHQGNQIQGGNGSSLGSHSGVELPGNVSVSIERTGTSEKLQHTGKSQAFYQSEINQQDEPDNADSGPGFGSTVGSLLKTGAKVVGNIASSLAKTSSGIVRTGAGIIKNIGGQVKTGTRIVETRNSSSENVGADIVKTGNNVGKTETGVVENVSSDLVIGGEIGRNVANIVETKNINTTADKVKDEIRPSRIMEGEHSQHANTTEVNGSINVSPGVIISERTIIEKTTTVMTPNGYLETAITEGFGSSVMEDGGTIHPSESFLQHSESFAISSPDAVDSLAEVHGEVSGNKGGSTVGILVKTGAEIVGNDAGEIVRTVQAGAEIVGNVTRTAVKTGSAIVRIGTNISGNVGVGSGKTGNENVQTGSEMVEDVNSGIAHVGSDIVEKGTALLENVGPAIMKTGTEIVGKVSSDIIEKGNKIVSDATKILQSNINATAQNVRNEFTHHHGGPRNSGSIGIKGNLKTEKVSVSLGAAASSSNGGSVAQNWPQRVRPAVVSPGKSRIDDYIMDYSEEYDSTSLSDDSKHDWDYDIVVYHWR